jgi:hypothetical protein
LHYINWRIVGESAVVKEAAAICDPDKSPTASGLALTPGPTRNNVTGQLQRYALGLLSVPLVLNLVEIRGLQE